VLRCGECDTQQIAYNSCRNRHCPKCQGATTKRWLADREADLLPVEYYHVVFTLPAAVADIAYQNKAVVYDLLFKATAETLTTLAADPKRLGVKLGFTAVLHTWGSAMTHHPHLHCIVPGGGLSPDGQWLACRKGFFLPVKVLLRLFRRLFLEHLVSAHERLEFYGQLQHLADPAAFAYLAPLKKMEWVVYAKRPFSGPEAVLAYLSRYTHRVAISNRRLVCCDEHGVTFKWTDYRGKSNERNKTMQLATGEFIRRFLIPILPLGFHRIRHFGILSNPCRADNLRLIRAQITNADPSDAITEKIEAKDSPTFVCPTCHAPMSIVELLRRFDRPRAPP
jgi:hypothetical protein